MRASLLLFLVQLMVHVKYSDGISFKKIYSGAKLNFDNKNNRKRFGKSSTRRSTYFDDEVNDDATEGLCEPHVYELNEEQYSDIPRGHGSREQVDVIRYYTDSVPAKILVSISSAFASALISSFLSMMLFSSVWKSLVKFFSAIFLLSGFSNSDMGDLSRSLGVFMILLLKQSGIILFFRELMQLLLASLSFINRRPFPPASNPWRYQRRLQTDPDFNMYRTLTTLLLLGSYLGRIVSCFLPLVPTWVDVIACSTALVYLGTLSTPQGDLTRYIGFSMMSSLSHMKKVAHEVKLFEKGERVASKVSSFTKRINEEHGVIGSMRKSVNGIVDNFVKLSERFQANMIDDDEGIMDTG